jgi:PAS domain S-box-containing protein
MLLDFHAGSPKKAPMDSKFIERQQTVLELIARRAPVERVLGALVGFVEAQAGDMRCAILLADPQQQFLRFAVASSLPDDYVAGFGDGVRIAPGKGSCGTAAYLRQPVYTRDTETDEVWGRDLREIAVRNGIRAVWSAPILSSTGALLGTLAMYYGEPRLPTEEHVQLIATATQLARIALEASSDQSLLQTVFEEAPFGVLAIDLADHGIRPNRAFARLLGYELPELAGKTLADITPQADHATLSLGAAPDDGGEVVRRRRYRTKDGRVLLVRERSTVNKGSAARYLVSRVESAVLQGDDPLERLSHRESQVLRLVVAGSSSRDIAARLHISPCSVDTYRSRIMGKLNLRHLPDLVRFAIDHGVEAKAAA